VSPNLRRVLLAAVLSAAAAASARADCAWPSPPAALSDDAGGFARAWTFASDPALLADAPAAAPGLSRYRAWARGQADTDGRALLRRQRDLYVKLGVKDGAAKLDAILAGQAGRIERMSCLETLLFSEHEARFPVETTKSEFLALVLRRGPEMKVYLISQRGQPGVGPSMSGVEPSLRRDRARGWTLQATLHNHPFMFDNPYGDIGGTLVPSGDAGGGDLAAFETDIREYGMHEAWITNGFETVRLDAPDVDRLVARASGQ
jgi:hypothetical protein